MALPKIDQPIYEVKLTSYPEPIKFRPFLVKEQKILLMAAESGESEEVLKAMKQVINNCVVSQNFDAEKLPMVDIELMFVNLRSRSVGENIDMFFKCNNEVEDGRKCGMVINIQVDLLNEVVPKEALMKNIIMVNDKVGVKMRYPTIDDIKFMSDLDPSEINVRLVANCIQQVFDDEQTFDLEKTSIEELSDFMDQIPSHVYEKMEAFLKDVPTITYDKIHPCPKCKYEHKIHLEGMKDFFI
jgi:hypothetical protein